jgi:molybdate transport system permease protein
MSRGRTTSRTLFRIGVSTASATLAALLVVPFIALFFDGGPLAIVHGLRGGLTLPALRLSLITTTLSLAFIVLGGTALAWQLSGRSGRLARWLEIVLQLPVVMPPAVGGIALLLAFGRRGVLGGWLDRAGLSPAFSMGAVVIAQVFVAAPFYLQAAITAFRGLDPNLLAVARSLGAAPPRVFFKVVLPLAKPALLSGLAMSWARALGEFGATLMFAGNLAGRTQTLPLAIYTALEIDPRNAQALSIVLVVFAFALLFLLRRIERPTLVYDLTEVRS